MLPHMNTSCKKKKSCCHWCDHIINRDIYEKYEWDYKATKIKMVRYWHKIGM